MNVPNNRIRTDLVLEQEKEGIYHKKIETIYGLKITTLSHEKDKYTTIEYQDITDKEEYQRLSHLLKKELKEYIHPREKDSYLVIGLGNPKSTPDSLGPKTLEEILVTRYLFFLGEVEKNISSVAIYKPDVCGNTGIESISVIKKIIQEIKPTKVIIIDALKASKLERLVKTIQITNTGIHPGSGIMNDQGEISKNTIHCDVIAIGIPTVVDKNTMLEKPSSDNYMVTPTNIDFLIERLSKLIGNTLNKIIHPTIFDK